MQEAFVQKWPADMAQSTGKICHEVAMLTLCCYLIFALFFVLCLIQIVTYVIDFSTTNSIVYESFYAI